MQFPEHPTLVGHRIGDPLPPQCHMEGEGSAASARLMRATARVVRLGCRGGRRYAETPEPDSKCGRRAQTSPSESCNTRFDLPVGDRQVARAWEARRMAADASWVVGLVGLVREVMTSIPLEQRTCVQPTISLPSSFRGLRIDAQRRGDKALVVGKVPPTFERWGSTSISCRS